MERKWWTLLAVCTGVFMLLLDITIVNVALPYIQQAFHASLADLQWVIDAYALTLAAFLLTSGSIAALVGRRLVFAVIVALREVAESKAPVPKRPDWPGFVTFTLGLTGLVYGLIRSHPDGWGSTTVTGSLVAAVGRRGLFPASWMRS